MSEEKCSSGQSHRHYTVPREADRVPPPWHPSPSVRTRLEPTRAWHFWEPFQTTRVVIHSIHSAHTAITIAAGFSPLLQISPPKETTLLKTTSAKARMWRRAHESILGALHGLLIRFPRAGRCRERQPSPPGHHEAVRRPRAPGKQPTRDAPALARLLRRHVRQSHPTLITL